MSKIFDQSGWLSGSTRFQTLGSGGGGGGPPPPPPPPPAGSFRTAIGSWALPLARWGTTPTPDNSFSDANGATLVNTGGHIDDAIAAGANLVVRVHGPASGIKDANGFFVPDLWKGKFDEWRSEVQGVSGGETKLRAAIASGVFRAVNVLDDFTSDQGAPFNRAVTFEEIEEICEHVKVTRGWDWLPLAGRGFLHRLKAMATLGGTVRQYEFLDAGWATFRPRVDTNALAYFQSEIAAGLACGLATVTGANLLDQGAGDTPGWGCQVGNKADHCAMSPAEVEAGGFAALSLAGSCGHFWWAYENTAGSHTYWDKTEIQAAMLAVYNQSQGRTDGPINVRGDLAAP